MICMIPLSNDAWWKLVHQIVMCHATEMQHRFIWNAKNVKYIKMQDKNPNEQGHVVTNANKFSPWICPITFPTLEALVILQIGKN